MWSYEQVPERDGRALLKCLIVLFACILRFCLRISRSRVLIKKILLHSKVRVPVLTSKFFASRSSIEVFFYGVGGVSWEEHAKILFLLSRYSYLPLRRGRAY